MNIVHKRASEITEDMLVLLPVDPRHQEEFYVGTLVDWFVVGDGARITLRFPKGTEQTFQTSYRNEPQLLVVDCSSRG